MQRWIRILVGAAALMVAALPVLSAQQIDMAQRQQEVRARETAFARSMADGLYDARMSSLEFIARTVVP